MKNSFDVKTAKNLATKQLAVLRGHKKSIDSLLPKNMQLGRLDGRGGYVD